MENALDKLSEKEIIRLTARVLLNEFEQHNDITDILEFMQQLRR
jgi:hypothetical protein